MSKTILILGGGGMQIPAIRIAKSMGWRVLVADGNAQSLGRTMADDFAHVDLKDGPAMAEMAAAYRKKHGLDGVFTAGTDFSATVAYVARELGLPGIPYEAALRATDKALMREAFRAAGVSSPAFVRCTANDDPLEFLAGDLSFPLVVKPVDNMGSRGVRKVSSTEELLEAVSSAIAYSRTRTAIIESYIEGPEFSIDSLVYKGKITICGIADRHIHFPPYFIEMGHTIPTRYPPDVVEKLIDVFCQGVRAIGIDNGAAKGDVKLSPNGPVIGEIAARLSGGYMSGWTFPYASGVEVTRGGLLIAVGESPIDLTPTRNHTSAERAWISIPGVVREMTGIEGLKRNPVIKEVFPRVKPGDTVVFPRNNVEKCGNIIAVDADPDIADREARKACASIFIRLEPNRGETRHFLFPLNKGTCDFLPDEEQPVTHAPWMFSLENEANQSAFSAMPLGLNMDTVTQTLRILPLPEFGSETVCDWYGRSIQVAFSEVVRTTGLVVGSDGSAALGRLFWQAFLKGGVQGGVWMCDSYRASVSSGEDFEAWARSFFH